MDARQQARIRRLIRAGRTVPQIAKVMDIGQQRIYRFCKKHEIEIVRATGRLPKDIEVIWDDIEKMGTVEAVATHYGVTRQAVYYRLDQYEEEDE